MALSYRLTTGDGSTRDFSFTFGYISASHVAATVDGEAAAFSWTGPFAIQFAEAPSVDAVIKIYRTTPRSAVLVSWQDSSTLKATNLTTDQAQLFYIAQETLDVAEDTITLDDDNKFDAQSKVIKNVAEPTADQDAATKAYVDTSTGLIDAAAVAAAKVAAEAAEDGAVAAQEAAEAAAASLTGALVDANNLDDVENVATARTNLGLGTAAVEDASAFEAADAAIIKGDTSATLTAGVLTTSVPLGNLNSATTLHISDGNIQDATMTGSFTLTAPDDTDEGYLELELTIDATGAYTLTLAGFNEMSGAVDTTANVVNVLRISKLANGTDLEVAQRP